MKIKKLVKSVIEKDVEVVSLTKISPTNRVSNLRCDSCRKPVGDARPIAVAWIKHVDSGKESGARFCNGCLVQYETEVQS